MHLLILSSQNIIVIDMKNVIIAFLGFRDRSKEGFYMAIKAYHIHVMMK